MLKDQQRFTRDFARLRTLSSEQRSAEMSKLSDRVDRSVETVSARVRSVPPLSYPEALPISEKRAEIAHAIKHNQIVVIAGETG